MFVSRLAASASGLLLALALTGCNGEQGVVFRSPHPDVDPEAIEGLLGAIADGRYGDVHSVLIVVDGAPVLEAYFGGHSWSERQALYSVTKSFLATLIGIAIGEGRISSAGERVVDYFPEYHDLEHLDAHKRSMTIADLLTMTAGLQWDELSRPYDDPANDYQRYLASPDRVRYALGLPMASPPGERFAYSTALSQILSVILTKATGMSAADYAERRLFGPLGIDDWRWTAYDARTSVGGAGLYLRSTDLAKLGQLYLQEGRWNGRQIVPATWVERCTSRHVSVDGWHDYGYHWWRYSVGAAQSHLDGHDDIYYALGRGGQFLWVLPHADAVVVCTAWNDTNGFWPEAMLWEFVGPAIHGR